MNVILILGIIERIYLLRYSRTRTRMEEQKNNSFVWWKIKPPLKLDLSLNLSPFVVRSKSSIASNLGIIITQAHGWWNCISKEVAWIECIDYAPATVAASFKAKKMSRRMFMRLPLMISIIIPVKGIPHSSLWHSFKIMAFINQGADRINYRRNQNSRTEEYKKKNLWQSHTNSTSAGTQVLINTLHRWSADGEAHRHIVIDQSEWKIHFCRINVLMFMYMFIFMISPWQWDGTWETKEQTSSPCKSLEIIIGITNSLN